MHARERSALRRLAPLGGGTALRQQREGWGVRASSHIVHRTSYIVFHRYIDPSFHVHRFETRAQHEFGRPSHISRVTAHKHKVPVQYPSSIGSPTLEPARPHPCLQFFLSRPPSHIHPASFYAISPAESRGSVCGWHGYLPHSLFASVRIGRCPIANHEIRQLRDHHPPVAEGGGHSSLVPTRAHLPHSSEIGFAGDWRYAVAGVGRIRTPEGRKSLAELHTPPL